MLWALLFCSAVVHSGVRAAGGKSPVFGHAWEKTGCPGTGVELLDNEGTGIHAVAKGQFAAVKTYKYATIYKLADCSDAKPMGAQANTCTSFPDGSPIQCVKSTL